LKRESDFEKEQKELIVQSIKTHLTFLKEEAKKIKAEI
jgi:hypothetical protein